MQSRNLYTDLNEFEARYSKPNILLLLKQYYSLVDHSILSLLSPSAIHSFEENEENIQEFDKEKEEAKKNDDFKIYYQHVMSAINTQAHGAFPQIKSNYNKKAFDMAYSKAGKGNSYYLIQLAKICDRMSEFYCQLQNRRKAIEYSLAALQIKIIFFFSRGILDVFSIAQNFNSLGIICYQSQMYQMSETFYTHALTTMQNYKIKSITEYQTKIQKLFFDIHYNLGITYMAMSNVESYIQKHGIVNFPCLNETQQMLIYLKKAEKHLSNALDYRKTVKIDPILIEVLNYVHQRKELVTRMQDMVASIMLKLGERDPMASDQPCLNRSNRVDPIFGAQTTHEIGDDSKSWSDNLNTSTINQASTSTAGIQSQLELKKPSPNNARPTQQVSSSSSSASDHPTPPPPRGSIQPPSLANRLTYFSNQETSLTYQANPDLLERHKEYVKECHHNRHYSRR